MQKLMNEKPALACRLERGEKNVLKRKVNDGENNLNRA